MLDANPRGTANVLGAAQSRGLDPIVHVSSNAALMPSDGRVRTARVAALAILPAPTRSRRSRQSGSRRRACSPTGAAGRDREPGGPARDRTTRTSADYTSVARRRAARPAAVRAPRRDPGSGRARRRGRPRSGDGARPRLAALHGQRRLRVAARLHGRGRAADRAKDPSSRRVPGRPLLAAGRLADRHRPSAERVRPDP